MLCSYNIATCKIQENQTTSETEAIVIRNQHNTRTVLLITRSTDDNVYRHRKKALQDFFVPTLVKH